MQKNIIYIFGNNSALIEEDKNNLVRIFREKYGTESVEICPLGDGENFQIYHDKIMSVGLFENMRMFVFSGGREKKSRSKKENSGFEAILEKILPNLSESDFLLFYNLGAGEENLKKWLEKNATPRKRNMSWIASEWAKKFELPENIAKKILLRYQNVEKLRDTGDNNPLLGHAISATMEHISILHKNGENIDDSIIAQFSHEYSGDKNFSLVDAILVENISKSLELRKKISENLTSPAEVNISLSSLIGILRKNAYILRLRDLGATQSQIIEKLP